MAASASHGLRNYVIRRLLLMIPTMLGVTMAIFLICQFVPGGRIDQLVMQADGAGGGGEGGGGGGSSSSRRSGEHLISAKDLAELNAYYGFDKPLPEQYFIYLKNLLRGDLGKSFSTSKPATEVIAERLPISLYYGLVTSILTYLVCIPLGIMKAIRHHSFFDNATSVLIFAGYAVPGFALGAVLLVFFSLRHDWFPLGGYKGENYDQLNTFARMKDIVHHSILPLICYMVGSFAFMTMLMKNSLLENMAADYVRTALAAGLTRRRALFVHALRNSLIPLATSVGSEVMIVLTGSLLIERVFNIQGMGLLFYQSMQSRDFPVVMAGTVIGAALLLIGNLISDLAVASVDPRVRFE
ncbi:ABC transporter permease subunit [soil metagenome]